MMTYAKYLLFLSGLILACQAEHWGNLHPQQGIQGKTVEEKDNKVQPLKSILKVKALTDEQKKSLYDSTPKMIEKTKILNKVRKLKDQGEERTKVIYRTRLIGMYNPRMIANLDLINKIFDESDEELDYSDADDGHRTYDILKEELKYLNKEIETPTNSEMPANQHSSKKELQNKAIPGKSIESVTGANKENENKAVLQSKNDLENASILQKKPFPQFKKVNFNDATEEDTETKLKQPMNTLKKNNFGETLEDENLTAFKKPPVSPVPKVNFVDSLELYKQQKKEEAFNELRNFVNNNILHINNPNPKPVLQRQFSIYRRPMVNVNNNQVKNADVKNEATNKPLYHHPLNPIILLPSGNNFINNHINNMKPQPVQTQSNNSQLNKINHAQPEPQTNTLRPDWISSLLMNRVAQAEAAQMAQLQAAQTQMNYDRRRDQQILQTEQQPRQQIVA